MTDGKETRLQSDFIQTPGDMKTAIRRLEARAEHKYEMYDTMAGEIKRNLYLNLLTLFIAGLSLVSVLVIGLVISIGGRFAQ